MLVKTTILKLWFCRITFLKRNSQKKSSFPSAVPKRGRSKRGRTQKHAIQRKWEQKSANASPQKSTKRARLCVNIATRLETTRFGNSQPPRSFKHRCRNVAKQCSRKIYFHNDYLRQAVHVFFCQTFLWEKDFASTMDALFETPLTLNYAHSMRNHAKLTLNYGNLTLNHPNLGSERPK